MKTYKRLLVIILLILLVALLLAGNKHYRKHQFIQTLEKSKQLISNHTPYISKDAQSVRLSEPLSATAEIATNDFLWTFTDAAPSFFAGKRFVQGREDKCFTEIEIEGVDCVVVSQEAMDKIQQLRWWHKANIAEREKQRQQANDVKDNQACEDWQAQLPEDYDIIHLWANRNNQDFGYQIKGDKGAAKAELVEVQINHSKRPVVLLLQNDYATVWKIFYTPETTIAAVWATGRNKQAPIGMTADTPVLTTSYYQPRCKRHVGNTISHPKLNKSYHTHTVVNGKIRIGRYSEHWLSHGDSKSLRKDATDGLLAGEMGLQQLLKQGAIRPLTRHESATIWQRQGKDYPYEYKDEYADEPINGSYVIKQAIPFPAGMYGGYSANFFIFDDDVPLPTGDMGHNDITLASGYCLKCYH